MVSPTTVTVLGNAANQEKKSGNSAGAWVLVIVMMVVVIFGFVLTVLPSQTAPVQTMSPSAANALPPASAVPNNNLLRGNGR